MTKLHNKRLRWVVVVALIFAAFSISATMAQTTGARLAGIVRDASQAVIPGVTVTATNDGTSISYTSLTNETGLYIFVTLPPGPYTLTCELQGFKRYINKGLVLTVGATLTVNIVLETGEISTEVVVSAAAPLVDVTSGKIGAVVQERQILDLPLNGRNPMDLFYLQAGVNPRGGGSVDGLRTNANNVKVDGVWASDASYDAAPSTTQAATPLEAIAEYRVTTSSATADAGRGAGAQVSAVYRSGTNEFHGSVYEFNRNTVYNANSFFGNRQGTARPVFLRNQYGAALGGPIFRNKTFFFGTWEGQRQVRESLDNRNVYTKALRDGYFRYNTTGTANATSMVDSKTGEPLVPFGTIAIFAEDPTRLGRDTSGIVDATLKKLPLPNNYDIGDGFNLAGYRFTSSNFDHYNQFLAKIDHTLSPSHQLSVAFGGYWSKSGDEFMFSGYRSNEGIFNKRNIMIGLVSALKPNLTNELRLGGTRRLGLGRLPKSGQL